MKSSKALIFLFALLLLLSSTISAETSQDENKLDEEGMKETNQYGGGRCYYGCCGGWSRYGCRWCCRTPADIGGEAYQVPNGYGYGGGGYGGGYGGGGYGGWGGYGSGGWGGRGGGGGGYGGGEWGGHGGYGGGGNCYYGCCGGGGYGRWGGCRCCLSAQEAKAYNENAAKP